MPVVHEVPFQVHWEPFVLSDINLGSFLRWAGETNEAEVREVFSQVYLGLHEGPLPETLHVTTVAGNSLALEHRPCNREHCERCSSGRGGYYFQFASSR